MPRSKSLRAPGPFLTLMLKKYNLSPFRLSKDIHLSQSAVRLIALGETKISVPVALRLAKYFNTNPEFWLAMQMKWDISEAEKDKDLAGILKNISQVKKGPAPKKAEVKKPAAKRPTAEKKAAKANKIASAIKPKAVKKTAVNTAKKPVAAKAGKTGGSGRSSKK